MEQPPVESKPTTAPEGAPATTPHRRPTPGLPAPPAPRQPYAPGQPYPPPYGGGQAPHEAGSLPAYGQPYDQNEPSAYGQLYGPNQPSADGAWSPAAARGPGRRQARTAVLAAIGAAVIGAGGIPGDPGCRRPHEGDRRPGTSGSRRPGRRRHAGRRVR